jgi:hypothetical protein
MGDSAGDITGTYLPQLSAIPLHSLAFVAAAVGTAGTIATLSSTTLCLRIQSSFEAAVEKAGKHIGFPKL